MNEQKILASVIKSRIAFDKIADHVADGDFTEQAAIIWRGLTEYYSRDPDATCADPEILAQQIVRTLSSHKHREQFQNLVKDIGGMNVSPANVVADFLAVRAEAAGAKLATALLSGKASADTIPLVEEYEKWATADALPDSDSTEILQGFSVEALKDTYSSDELIKLWPSALNERLDGGLLRGHHVVVFARPEMGKTLFTINATAGFLAQGLTVLYVGNEDPVRDLALRTICRLCKRSKYDVLDHPKEAYEMALDKGYDRLILAPLAPGTPRQIEQLVQEYKPDVVIIDQLRNLTMKEDNRVVQLEQAATAARNIGKKYGVLVISVTQAGDSATGRAVLDMGDVDSSNTGIPAQADVMVGIGATTEDMEMGRRVLSLPKNKRSGKHENFAVRVDETCSRMYGTED